MTPIRSRCGWKIVSTAGQGNQRDSALPMARLVGDAERWSTSWQCAGQHGHGSSTRDHEDVAGQSMISGRIDLVKIKYL